jgi:hypothetical protein
MLLIVGYKHGYASAATVPAPRSYVFIDPQVVNPYLPGGSVKRSLAMVFCSMRKSHPQGLRP